MSISKKEMKEVIKGELSPLLIVLRNAVENLGGEIAGKKITLEKTENGVAVGLLRGDPGYTPVKGKDYSDGKDGYTPKKGKDYHDGKDGKRGPRGSRGISVKGDAGYTPIKGKDYFDGEDGKPGKDKQPLTGVEIVNMIDQLIEPENILGLKEYIKEIAGTPMSAPVIFGSAPSSGGSGQTVTFLTETPSGLINGSNKVYTVSQSIATIVGFAINGQVIHPSQYTFSGNQINFITALDASYAGLPFTVTYIPK